MTLYFIRLRSYILIKASEAPTAKYSLKIGLTERHFASIPGPASADKLIKMPTSSSGALISVSMIVPSSEALQNMLGQLAETSHLLTLKLS